MEIIKLNNVNFFYNLNSFEIKGISFSCPEKILIGLAGPNGSGKSTLLKLIAGIEKPKNGAILIKEKNLKEYKAVERAKILRWIGQNEIGKISYKVIEYLYLGTFPLKGYFGRITKEDKERAEYLLDYFYLSKKKDWEVENLSGGERKLLQIAFSLISSPEIMLLDEPFAHLDPIHLKALFNLIKKEKEKGITFIISSHEYNILKTISDYLLLISDGEMVCFDKPSNIKLDLWEKTFKIPFVKKESQDQLFPDIFS